MEKMRILILCESKNGKNGWAVYGRQLMDEMEKEGHDLRVYTKEMESGILMPPPLQIFTRPWAAYFLARSVKKFCRQWMPDIIHITVEPYALLAAFLPHSLASRTIMTVHGSYGVRLLQNLPTRWLALRMYRKLGGCIAVSEYTKAMIAAEIRMRGGEQAAKEFLEKTTVIKNAVSMPDEQPERLNKPEKMILCVGGVKPRKGILEAIEGCRVYKQNSTTPFRFMIVGTVDEGDAYVREVRERIGEAGLKNEVTLTGPLSTEELSTLYAKADLYLMPAKTTSTTFEGFGIVFLEANANGVPVIGPNTSGAAEAIVEAKTGFHVNPEDAAEIADRMKRVLDDKTIDATACIAWAREHNPEGQWKAVSTFYQTATAPSQAF